MKTRRDKPMNADEQRKHLEKIINEAKADNPTPLSPEEQQTAIEVEERKLKHDEYMAQQEKEVHSEVTEKFTDELLQRTPRPESLSKRLEIKITPSLYDQLTEFVDKCNEGLPREDHISRAYVIRGALKKFLSRKSKE